MAKKTIFSVYSDRYVVNEDIDFHCKDGIISAKDIKKGGRVKSTKNKNFYVTDTLFVDKLLKIKRGPAVVRAKDAGAIMAHTGLGCGDRVVDAGSGCGVLASYLGRIVGDSGLVVTYERREDFFKIAKKNIEFLEVKNVKLKNKDVFDGISEKKLDLVTLDLPNPWEGLDQVYDSLKTGGFLVCFLPTIIQVKELAEKIDDSKFFVEKTIENLEREWHVDGKKLRPKNQMIGHTAFLVFLRKL